MNWKGSGLKRASTPHDKGPTNKKIESKGSRAANRRHLRDSISREFEVVQMACSFKHGVWRYDPLMGIAHGPSTEGAKAWVFCRELGAAIDKTRYSIHEPRCLSD